MPRRRLERWAKRAELALFTGRTRRELRHTLDHFGVADLFRRVVTMDDVSGSSRIPKGLRSCSTASRPERGALSRRQSGRRAGLATRRACRFSACFRTAATRTACAAGSCAATARSCILHNASELEKYWK